MVEACGYQVYVAIPVLFLLTSDCFIFDWSKTMMSLLLLYAFITMISQAKDICSADACKVTPAKFSGSKEIVPLHIRRPVSLLNL